MGPIKKMGSSHLWKLLTESAWHYARPVYVGRRLAERRIGTDEEIVAYADKAQSRLHGKFTKLVFRGKQRNVVVIAVARELAGFIWGAMNMTA